MVPGCLHSPTWSLSPHPPSAHSSTPSWSFKTGSIPPLQSSTPVSSLAANHHPLFCFFLTSPNEAHHLVPEEAADRSQPRTTITEDTCPEPSLTSSSHLNLILILTPLGRLSSDPTGRIGQRDRHPNQKQEPSRLILSLRRLGKAIEGVPTPFLAHCRPLAAPDRQGAQLVAGILPVSSCPVLDSSRKQSAGRPWSQF